MSQLEVRASALQNIIEDDDYRLMITEAERKTLRGLRERLLIEAKWQALHG